MIGYSKYEWLLLFFFQFIIIYLLEHWICTSTNLKKLYKSMIFKLIVPFRSEIIDVACNKIHANNLFPPFNYLLTNCMGLF
jgi:hypothetical protein